MKLGCSARPAASQTLVFLQGTADLEREDEEEMEDSGEVLDDSSSSPSSTLKNYPLTCKVLYSYKVRAQARPLPPVVHR